MAIAAFASRLADATPAACTVAPFRDVPVGHPFCAEISWLKQNNITAGTPMAVTDRLGKRRAWRSPH